MKSLPLASGAVPGVGLALSAHVEAGSIEPVPGAGRAVLAAPSGAVIYPLAGVSLVGIAGLDGLAA